MRSPVTTAALGLALTILAGGCSTSGGLLGGSAATSAASNGEASTNDGGQTARSTTERLRVYLETMLDLIEGDALDQAETFNDVRDAAEFAPTRINRLRYALALSVPGHPGTDPEAAAEQLRDLLAGNTLLPEERMLAEIQLETANELSIVRDANRQIEARLAEAEAARDADYEAQLESLRAQNEELRAELENARTTLDAITNIERSLSEREDDTDE